MMVHTLPNRTSENRAEAGNGNEPSFTKGPWEWREMGHGTLMLVTRHGGSRAVLSARQNGIQTRDANGTLRYITEDHPNARLIAAAPDLYRCLTDLISNIESGSYESTGLCMEECHAVLAKARGKNG